MSVTLPQLRALVTVADTGSLTAAAARLHFTQSAVSQQVAALEQEIGLKLLDRRSRGVALTACGEALVARARTALAQIDLAQREVRAVSSGELGELRLAAFPTASAALLPPALATLRRQRPRLRVHVEELESGEALDGVRAGAFDLALAFDYTPTPAADGIEIRPLLDDPLLVGLPSDHPLATEPMVDLGALAGEPWIGGRTTSSTLMLNALCTAAGFAPRLGPVTSNYTTAQGLVAAGLGVALIPALALEYPRRDVAFRQLTARPSRRIFAAMATDRAAPAARALVGTLEGSAPTGRQRGADGWDGASVGKARPDAQG